MHEKSMADAVRLLAREVELTVYPNRRIPTSPGAEWCVDFLLTMGLYIQKRSREKHGTTDVNWLLKKGVPEKDLNKLMQPDIMGRCVGMDVLDQIAQLLGFEEVDKVENVRSFMTSALRAFPAEVNELLDASEQIKISLPALRTKTFDRNKGMKSSTRSQAMTQLPHR